jgi:uncharacterized protein
MPSARLLSTLLCLCTSGVAFAQETIDAKLLAQINQIRVIDNHTHADAVDRSRPDRWKIGNPLGEPRYPDVMPLARNNPQWKLAWAALYGYGHDDATLSHLQALLGEKRKALAVGGEAWPAAVLDKAGVDIALVNTVRLGPGLDNARFRWVPYADPMLRPFSGSDSPLLYSGGEVSISALLSEAGVATLPATLSEYRTRVIEATLARWKKNGAVAIKFLSAYARGLDVELVSPGVAAEAFARGAGGAPLAPADSKALEDYLFGEIAAAAGANGLVVHIHTGNGDGPYFNNRRADPDLLENLLNSRPMRKTNFVLLHGGWPYTQTTQAMLDKPNTYADFSAQTFYLTTHALAQVLRGWIEWHPEKVLFGSDAYSDVDSPLVDWEEKQWLMTFKARRALAIALTGIMLSGEISRERAVEIAQGVLRDNAVKLYSLSTSPR